MFMGQVYTNALTPHVQQALHAMCHPFASLCHEMYNLYRQGKVFPRITCLLKRFAKRTNIVCYRRFRLYCSS